MVLLEEGRQEKLKLKYTGNTKQNYGFVFTSKGKQHLNLTVDNGAIIEVDKTIGEGLLRTNDFIEIKKEVKTKKLDKREEPMNRLFEKNEKGEQR